MLFFRILSGCFLCLVTATAVAQSAGKAILVIGNVFVVRGGVESPLNRNDMLQSGDVIKTMPLSNAQIRMNDESLIALRPGTEFKIEEFRYEGKQDGSERGFFSLIKGGFRTVTGAVGKLNRDNYKVTTPTATVGIRGTHYTLIHCQNDCDSVQNGAKLASLNIAQTDAAPPAVNVGPRVQNGTYGGVQEGRIALTNESKILNQFGAGDFFFVSDSKSPPQRLIAPPEFLRDKLEGRARNQQKGPERQGDTAQANVGGGGAGNNNQQKGAEQQGDNAQANAGGGGGGNNNQQKGAEQPGDGVQANVGGRGNNNVPQPPAAPVATPLAFAKIETEFRATEDKNNVGEPIVITDDKTLKGDGVYPVGTNLALMSAEYNTSYGDHNAFNAGTGYVISADTRGVLSTLTGTDGYSRNDAKSKEAGADGGTIAWARWADGTPTLYGWGNQTLTENQGFHMIVGDLSTSLPSQNAVTFNLLGATQPTETRAGALGGWSVTSGSVVANFLSSTLTGNLGLSLSRTGEAGSFAMNFSGTAYTGFNSLTSTVTRTAGTAALCVSTCSGSGTLMFAGPNATHAGMIYEFNAGTYYVQGAAAFKR